MSPCQSAIEKFATLIVSTWEILMGALPSGAIGAAVGAEVGDFVVVPPPCPPLEYPLL
jgi:hypothetical protein